MNMFFHFNFSLCNDIGERVSVWLTEAFFDQKVQQECQANRRGAIA